MAKQPDSVPRDLPDQQADPEETENETETTEPGGDAEPRTGTDDAPEGETGPDVTVPDSDVAGTGRTGAPHAPGIHPDQPVPDEPAD
ncbi:hypothetical protein ACOKM3_12035 [Streptomyces sp. BH106]|uniref:hypothetical protein n=1 Tax=Streptomyces sp. BH106 TaxID=3410409 RepID=UPI003CE78934